MSGVFDSQVGLFDTKVGLFDAGGTDALTADPIATLTPSLSSPSVTSNAALSATSILTSAPNILAATITQEHSLTPTVIVTGSPLISTTGFAQDHQLSPTSFTTQSPEVSTPDLIENAVFATANLQTGAPLVSAANFAQTHNLSPTPVITARPQIQSTADPDWLIDTEIQELQQMFGGWPRRSYEVPDGRLVQAEREIERQFGEKVSIDRKAKSLIKFGKSAPLVTGSLQTIWTVGGNETYVSGNTIDSISSSSALDTQEIYLECHTVDENGDFTFISQVIALNGQNRVALPVPVARVSLAYNNNGTGLVGRVAVYENTALTNGIPTDVTKIHIDIPAGLQESFKAATTFSSTDYFILTGGFGSVSLKQDGAADFYLEIREKGKVFRQVAAVSAASASPWNINLDPAVILPKNCDIRVRVETSSNNVVVFTVFQGYLAKIL